MITSITKIPEKSNEDIAIEKLIEDFNKEAKNKKSKYHIELKYNYPHLVKKLLFKLWEDISIQIYYNKNEDEFSFIGGICEETFEEIKPILQTIKQKFKVELL